MSRQKAVVIILVLAVVGIMFILAGSLTGLELSPGKPFALATQTPAQGVAPVQNQAMTSLVWVMRAMVGLLLVLFPLYIIYSLFTAKGRKRLLTDLIRLAIIILALELLQRAAQNVTGKLSETSLEQMAMRQTESVIPVPTPSTFTPNPPEWLTFAAILVVAVLIALVILAFLKFLNYMREMKKRSSTDLFELANEAQEAINNLQDGENLRDVVIRCYSEMSRVLQVSRGIRRDQSMTPREFEVMLEQKGLPGNSVRKLTLLFEEVRYGDVVSSDQEQRQAILCLQDIVNACKRMGAAN